MATNRQRDCEASSKKPFVQDDNASGLNHPLPESSQQQREEEERRAEDERKGEEKKDIHDTPSKPPNKKRRLADGPSSTRQTRSMTTKPASSPVKKKEPDRSAKASRKLSKRRHSSTDAAAASGDRTTQEWEVERIVDSFVDRKESVHWYQVKWKGWPPSANTWEAKVHLHKCRKAIADFEEASREQEKKRRKRIRKH